MARDGNSERTLWLLIFGVLAARIVLLVTSPLGLAADEAHYWDWSRHLDLSYYSKGPGVAWVIWLSTAIFGHAEWAVRVPGAISGAVSMLALARLAQLVAGDRRSGAGAAIAFCCAPVFVIAPMIMTIDGPYVACWSVSAWAAFAMFCRLEARRSAVGPMLALGLALGIGFLFKYTILLLPPGVLVYALLRRKSIGWNARASVGALVGFAAFMLAISPVLIWNHQQGWPTVSHLLGHLGAPGGDMAHAEGEVYNPLWPLMFLGAQIGFTGPMGVLMVWAVVRAARSRPRRSGEMFLVHCAAPILVFYFAIACFIEAEANWAMAGYTTLIALVGVYGPRELDRHRAMVRAWLEDPDRPKRGLLRRKPETVFQFGWHWSIGTGVVVASGYALLPLLDRVPLLDDVIPLHRIAGAGDRAAVLAEQVRTHHDETAEALVMADRYTKASLMAYELFRIMGEDAPVVTSAASRLGDRRSSYDTWSMRWPETDVRNPRWLGTTVHLVGGGEQLWSSAFSFDAFEVLDEEMGLSVGFGYGGLREP
ncbi:MAG: glycosyltransferase family 39 protein [Planctomycetota bacterium]